MTIFELTLKTPETPNFIFTDRDGVKIHVSELSTKQVNDLARQWKADLIEAAKKTVKPDPHPTVRPTGTPRKK